MLAKIKTALLGNDLRTDGGRVLTATGTDDPRAGSVSEIDPVRPATDLTDGATDDPVGMDQIFGILSNQRRRYALTYLSRTGGTVSLSDLAEQIAAWEDDKEIRQVTSKERKCVYVGLYQCHLPKMADASAISYDKRSGDIEPGEQFDRFSHYLRNGK